MSTHSLRRIGLAVHPTRDIHETVQTLLDWSEAHDVDVVQIQVFGQQQEVAGEGAAGSCDLIVAIGGDGTTLAAIRAAAAVGRPVLGVAAGSLGALTTLAADDLARALEAFNDGEWEARDVPALRIRLDDREDLVAFNDLAIVRNGEGQVRTSASVNGTLYARMAGDGCVVSTPIGSSAYSFAAGGPLFAPETAAFLLTPLSNHGGSCPPLVVSATARLELELRPAFGGVRLEVDGKVAGHDFETLSVQWQEAMATIVAFAGEEPLLSGLRRRGIIIDSPRILAEDIRAREHDQA